jgi:hypothetical protein
VVVQSLMAVTGWSRALLLGGRLLRPQSLDQTEHGVIRDANQHENRIGEVVERLALAVAAMVGKAGDEARRQPPDSMRQTTVASRSDG